VQEPERIMRSDSNGPLSFDLGGIDIDGSCLVILLEISKHGYLREEKTSYNVRGDGTNELT
jgi:hypothetical protein